MPFSTALLALREQAEHDVVCLLCGRYYNTKKKNANANANGNSWECNRVGTLLGPRSK